MTRPKKKTVVVLCVVAVVAGWLGLLAYRIVPKVVMTKVSPDGARKAVLWRSDSIDVNFHVYLDGKKIYWSADFAPVRTDFREQIYWDKAGDMIVLEVAGVRLFGYSVKRQKELTEDEFLAVQPPTLRDLGYEGKIRGEPESR